ncbi:MAG: PKD domain-containing protein, partial [Sphingobacteriales bacterium]
KPFTLDFSATDPDATTMGDSLVYTFCSAYNGGGATGSEYTTPAPAPFPEIPYKFGYTGTQPLGPRATINTETGIISGIAPDAGKYVVSVCVTTYRNGRFINTHRKDFIVTVAPCDFAGAQLNPTYTSCDGFTVNFTNLNNSPLNLTYYWDFGDGTISTDESPVHTYGSAGDFPLKLVINRGGNCADSTTAIVKVYPGYFPGFTNNSPMCKGIPVQFTDITTANYGAANSWKWDFGIPSDRSDTSRLKNPAFIYQTPGDYTVKLIVASDKGCVDTVDHVVSIVDKPAFTVTNDTLICAIDNLTLHATASVAGSVVWTPNYNINNVNSFNPVVSPDVTTTYQVRFSDNFGCTATDSVRVRVVSEVTLSAAPDTTICLTDSVRLRLNTDALYFTWTPAATIRDPRAQSPFATPVAPVTTYNVRASISANCFKDETIVVSTVPYP